jgi:hypothetical protein
MVTSDRDEIGDKIKIFNRYHIYRATATTLITKVSYITKCLGIKIVKFSAFLARY